MVPVRYKSKGVICETASSSPFNLYTCPARCFAKVVFLRATNLDSVSRVTVEWYDSSDSLSYALADETISTNNSALILDHSYVLLEAGDRLDVTISTDGEMHVVATVEEIFQPPVA